MKTDHERTFANLQQNQTRSLGPTTTYLHLSIDKCSQISRVVGVPDVYVMRRNVQLLVSGAQELQLGEPDLQGVSPVWQDLHGNIQGRGDFCWGITSLQRQWEDSHHYMQHWEGDWTVTRRYWLTCSLAPSVLKLGALVWLGPASIFSKAFNSFCCCLNGKGTNSVVLCTPTFIFVLNMKVICLLVEHNYRTMMMYMTVLDLFWIFF